MKKSFMSRVLAVTLSAAMAFSLSSANLVTTEAATAKLTVTPAATNSSSKRLVVLKGKTATFTVKSIKGWKVSAKSSSAKVAKVTSKTVTSKTATTKVKVKGVKAGNATITITAKKSGKTTKQAKVYVYVGPTSTTLKSNIATEVEAGKQLTWKLANTNAWKVIDAESADTSVATARANNAGTAAIVKGVKEGSSKITVTYAQRYFSGKTNAKDKTTGKTLDATVTVKAAAEQAGVAVTGVTLSTTTPKVGDTVTATVAPKDATNVTYQWFTGATSSLTTQISGQTASSLTITSDMVGKFIGVVVNGENSSSATAVSSVAVQEADANVLELTDAKQAGAKVVQLTINGKATSSDKITVKKGTTEVKIDDTAWTDTGATITLADKITAAEYTVTLTPADTKVSASSVKFTGEVSELQKIAFKNKYLVMKDNNYDTGYCYIEGLDQFGGQVTLAGVTVTAGLGDFQSYDSDTGKITIKADTTTTKNPYLLIKEVPVFVQYQEGNNVITANETLTVSAQSYVNEITFGDVTKDGTMRDDKRLTITELNSGKYYIPLTTVKDQYGNDMDADLLNKQKDDDKTLFVIPGTTGAFYTTGKFGTLKNQVVLYITGAARPGTMALSITGTGGKTFTKDITVEDDPYIQTLTVAWPELYSQNTESAALEFSAVDQYGQTFNLWDVKPVINGTAVYNATQSSGAYLNFNDQNHLTNSNTSIAAPAGAKFKEVKYDSSKKTFTVTIDASGLTAKGVAVFTITTAGLSVTTKSITVGEVGIATKVKSALKSGANTQLDDESDTGTDRNGDNGTLNFNKYVQFEDINGNTMKRSDDLYPKFKGEAISSANLLDYDSKATFTDYYWTLTDVKVEAGATFVAKDLTPTVGTDYCLSATGEVSYEEVADAGSDVYVTVYGVSGSNYYILDSKTFHLTRVGRASTDKSYKLSTEDTLYVSDNSGDSAKIKVEATTNTGEVYTVNSNRISVVAAGFSTNENTIQGYTAYPDRFSDTGTITATVYVDGKSVDDISVPYSKAEPVAKKAKLKYEVVDTTAGKVGATFDGDCETDDFEPVKAATYKIADGLMTITSANKQNDTVYAQIEDQYGNTMKDTKFYVDGKVVSATTTDKPISTDRVKIQYTNGSVSNSFYVKDADGSKNITVADTATSDVATADALLTALAKAAADTSSNSTITLTASASVSEEITIAEGDTLIIPEGVKLTTTGNVTNNGTLTVNGIWNHSTGVITNSGTVSITGTTNVDKSTVAGDGTWKTGGETLHFIGEVVLAATGLFTGNMVIEKGATVKFTAEPELAGSLKVTGSINFNDKAVTLGTITLNVSEAEGVSGGKNIKVAEESKATIVTTSGTSTVNNTEASEEKSITIAKNAVGGATETESSSKMSTYKFILSEKGEAQTVDGVVSVTAKMNNAEVKLSKATDGTYTLTVGGNTYTVAEKATIAGNIKYTLVVDGHNKTFTSDYEEVTSNTFAKLFDEKYASYTAGTFLYTAGSQLDEDNPTVPEGAEVAEMLIEMGIILAEKE